MNSSIARATIAAGIPTLNEPVSRHQLNDISDLYSDTDTLFAVTVISDAMRRGIKHFKLDGTSLYKLDDIVEALAEDGEVIMDMDDCEHDSQH